MDKLPFRSRIVQLMQRSRKALRLYSSVERFQNDTSGELAETQVKEWRAVNTDLLKELGAALELPNQRRLVGEVFGIRDQFYGEWKLAEADLHRKQRQLMDSAESGDFIKAALLSQELVGLKARAQACQAAHHELNEIITKSRVSQPAIELEEDTAIIPAFVEPDVVDGPRLAKVIPLRRRG